MAAKWLETLTGSREQKRQYKQYRARLEALPEPYLTAAKAVDRYLMSSGSITDGAAFVTRFGDLVELWECAAADGTPVRDIVGEDPVEFTETFRATYADKEWVERERARLRDAIDGTERSPE